jgi:hypothetical protein
MQNIADNYEFLMILAIVSFFIAIGSLITWIFTRPSGRASILRFEGVVGPFFGLPGVLFSLSAALMATSLWENYDVANKSVRTESQGIGSIIDLSQTIPSLQNSNLALYAKQYAKSVVEDEWQTLSSNSEPSAITKQHYVTLRQATFKAADSLGNNAESKALMHAMQLVSNGRMTRLAFVSFDVHPVRWYGIIVLAILVQLAVAFVHLTKPKALVAAMAIATATVLVPICAIALTLSSPYLGVISISNNPFLHFIK